MKAILAVVLAIRACYRAEQWSNERCEALERERKERVAREARKKKNINA